MTKPDKSARLSSQPSRPLSWRVPVSLDDVPETGRHLDLVASEAERAEIAALAGLRALDRLEATFDVSRRGDGLHVSGRVRAEVGQTCVVTLEPLGNTVEEDIDLTFSPSAPSDRDEVLVVPSEAGAEPPEPLEGGEVDLAALAVEFLMLGIEPYPRKPGAKFETAMAGDPAAEAASHPFAALAALKRRDDAGGG